MAFLLRKIKKGRWYKHEAVPWLKQDELQADALLDLQTKGNKLSIWRVEDDRSNLNRIIAALVSTCDNATNIDFALLKQSIIDTLDIKIEKANGDSHDHELNQTCHLHLVELTTAKLYKLLQEIQKPGIRGRCLEKQVINLVIEATRTGKIPRTKLSQTIQNKLDQITSKIM